MVLNEQILLEADHAGLLSFTVGIQKIFFRLFENEDQTLNYRTFKQQTNFFKFYDRKKACDTNPIFWMFLIFLQTH